MRGKIKTLLSGSLLMMAGFQLQAASLGEWSTFGLNAEDSQFQTSDLDYGTSFSIGFWLNASSAGTILTHGSEGDALSVSLAEDGELSVEKGNLSLQASAVSLSQWHHCVVVANSTTISLYVDGVLVAEESGEAVATFDPSGDLVFGAEEGTLEAEFQEVKILDEALTAEEIVAEFEGADLSSFEAREKTISRLNTSGNGTSRPPVPDLSSSTGGGGCLLRRR